MAVVDIVLLALTALALPWAIIELGLSAYIVNLLDTYDNYYEVYSELQTRADFLLFASLWTILVAIILLVFPLVFGKHGASPRWASPLTIALHGITMIFWLAGFAAWANLFIAAPPGTLGAALAFAIMLWLIFLGLFVLSLLTFFGVLQSTRFGYSGTSRRTTSTIPTSSIPAV